MNLIQKTISEISMTIPSQILDRVFSTQTISWEEGVRNRVLRTRFHDDMDLLGGFEKTINLGQVEVLEQSDVRFVFRIPKAVINGASVITATNIKSIGYITNRLMGSGIGGLHGLVERATHSNAQMGEMATSLTIIGDNTILSPRHWSSSQGEVTVIVSNDPEGSSIPARSITALANIGVLVTKAYIYKELVLDLSQGNILNGHDFSAMTDWVEKHCADSNAEYLEWRSEKAQKVLAYADPARVKADIAISLPSII